MAFCIYPVACVFIYLFVFFILFFYLYIYFVTKAPKHIEAESSKLIEHFVSTLNQNMILKKSWQCLGSYKGQRLRSQAHLKSILESEVLGYCRGWACGNPKKHCHRSKSKISHCILYIKDHSFCLSSLINFVCSFRHH